MYCSKIIIKRVYKNMDAILQILFLCEISRKDYYMRNLTFKKKTVSCLVFTILYANEMCWEKIEQCSISTQK